ncbi:MAG: NAD(P)/FAD-dependent oxidoreductase [Acidobacteria bacterium]|nr:NAD(P)/FAD-dependent oxidoreductase [Acidobacteriota bacterium]
MKRVAVLGGGPAGAFAAERLASAGIDTVLIDEKLAWEKPCGGGLTYKAYSQYPFLIDNNTPKKVVSDTCLNTSRVGSFLFRLSKPLVIYSRIDLNGMLLKRAEAAGATLERARVMGLERRGRGWLVKTQSGVVDADLCVVATGARNALRNVGTRWTAEDTMMALGYYVPASQEHVDIEFLPNFEGYIWIFPRDGHLSAGICGKGVSSQAMRQRLEKYLADKGISLHGATFYAHVLPSLERPAWKSNRVAGEGWMAVGDSAGLVDPITGEGIYYAIRSADLAARMVLGDAHSPAEQPAAYRALLQRDFVADLELAAWLAKRFFLGRFLCRQVPGRMIQFMRRSPTFCELMQDLFAGSQNYLDLQRRVVRSLNGTVAEVLMNFFLRRVVPGASQA